MGRPVDKDSVAARVRTRVLHSQRRVWKVEDFVGSPSAVNNELRRLVAQGELARIRRGVYWRGRKGRFGMVGVPQGDAVRKILGRGEAIGASGWHASNLLGLSTQVAPVETWAVTHRRPEGLENIKIVSRAGRSGRRDARLNELEVTFLEVLDGWDRYVELDGVAALRRLSEILDEDSMRIDRLVKASSTEPPAVRERLRTVLRRSGHASEAEKVPAARDPRTRSNALRVLSRAV